MRENRFPSAMTLRIETETGPERVSLKNVSRTGGKALNLPLVIEGERLRFVLLDRVIRAVVTRIEANDEVGFAFDAPLSDRDLGILRSSIGTPDASNARGGQSSAP